MARALRAWAIRMEKTQFRNLRYGPPTRLLRGIFHIISYHIISYHIISYHIISYHIISYHIISYHIISYHIISYHIISYHIISYHIVSYRIISYHIISQICAMEPRLATLTPVGRAFLLDTTTIHEVKNCIRRRL